MKFVDMNVIIGTRLHILEQMRIMIFNGKND